MQRTNDTHGLHAPLLRSICETLDEMELDPREVAYILHCYRDESPLTTPAIDRLLSEIRRRDQRHIDLSSAAHRNASQRANFEARKKASSS